MKEHRLVRLERLIRSRPCPGCARPFPRPDPSGVDWDRLSGAEQSELIGLLAAASTPACSRCGRSGHDLSRMTDAQLDRTLQLLRALLGPAPPALAGFCDAWAVGRSST
jgi:hypothetical protein